MIHGGRNDEMYNDIHNIGLNDLHMLDIMSLTWVSVAIYHEIPSSRWSHVLCAEDHNSDYEGSRLIIFGGVSMSCMCSSTLNEIDLSK